MEDSTPIFMDSELLIVELPALSVNAHKPAAVFLDECESTARRRNWEVDRRHNYAMPAGPSDQLNIHLGDNNPMIPMLRLVCPPPCTDTRLDADVVCRKLGGRPTYDEYLEAAKKHYGTLFGAYRDDYGVGLRLGIPRRPVFFDPHSVDCNRIAYIRPLFHYALRSMAVGAGDIRERLQNAYSKLHVVQPSDLPPPLDGHYSWIVHQLTWREPRYEKQGKLDATVFQMRRSTGAKVAERLQQVADAVTEIARKLCDGDEYHC